VTERFLLSDREVSVGLFQQFMDDPEYPGAEKPNELRAWWEPQKNRYSASVHHPAHSVSWYDAVMFCNWLSHREGLRPCYERTGEIRKDSQGEATEHDNWRLDTSANGYRLPTDAEWEYACRAGTSTIYSFGDDVIWLDDYAVYRSNQNRAEPCGIKLPNGWGLFDMHGNVDELCGGGTQRGGSWLQSANLAKSSSVGRSRQAAWSADTGFRVAANPFKQGDE